MVLSLETRRLALAPLRVDHAAEMATVLADRSLYEFTGGRPPTSKELEKRYRRQIAGPTSSAERWCNWVIAERSTARAIGFVQATVIGPAADLAWVLGVNHQGHGYATEAITAVCAWLRSDGVHRFEAHIHPRHVASQGVARRIGLAATGECDDDGEEIWAAAWSGDVLESPPVPTA